MDERTRGMSRTGGYGVVLLGVVGFVASCFLPYLGGQSVLPPGEGSVSLYRLVTSGPGSSVEQLGGALYLFAGAATVGLIALAGIRRPRPWTPYALSAGTAAWALTWVGVLINQVGFGPHDVGYWMLLASVAVSAAGTIAVWVSARTRDREPSPAAP